MKRLASILLALVIMVSLIGIVPVGVNAAVLSDTATLTVTPNITQIDAISGTAAVVYTITFTPPAGKSVSNFDFKLVAPSGMTLATTPSGKGKSGYWVNQTALKYAYDFDTETEKGFFTEISYTPGSGVFVAYGASGTHYMAAPDIAMTIGATISDASKAGSYALTVLNLNAAPNGTDTYTTNVVSNAVTVKAALPLVKDVTFTGKDAAGSNYEVALNPEEGKSYKAYVKDAVYGWTLVRPYAAYTEPFSITVANTDPEKNLEIEVLESTNGVPGLATPTYSKTLAQLGQLDATASLNAASYNVSETITLNASVILADPASPIYTASANYEVYLPDSGKFVKGSATGAIDAVTATATKPGTYKASVRFYDPENVGNEIVKTISYTVVEAETPANLPFFNGGKFTVSGDKANLSKTNPSIDQNGAADAPTYKYRFVSPTGGDKYSYGPAATLAISKPGIYYAYADIISGGVVADTAFTTVKINRTELPVSITSVTADEITSGTYLFTVNAVNAEEYMFIRRDETGYRTVETWSGADNTWTWTPARDGQYEIYAYAKRSDAGSYEAVKSVTVDVGSINKTVTVPTPEVKQNNVIVTDLTALAGKATTLTADLETGTKIAYEIYDPFSNTYIFSGYGDGTFTFVPAKARTYQITTLVKADTNSGAYDNKATTDVKFN